MKKKIPWDTYEEKWSAALSSGESPDIGYLYAEMYANYITSGLIEELSDYMTKEDYDEYLYLDRGEMMGGLYGVPIVTGVPFVLYYNQDILNDLGDLRLGKILKEYAKKLQKIPMVMEKSINMDMLLG